MQDWRSIEWVPYDGAQLVPGFVRFIDQSRLPNEFVTVETDDWRMIEEALRAMRIRGAPVIGIAAAFGIALAAQEAERKRMPISASVENAAQHLRYARKTTVNLVWAVDTMMSTASRVLQEGLGPHDVTVALAREAVRIWREDEEICRAIGKHGLTLLGKGTSVLTHCNAGALATARYGTALAPVYLAHEQGMSVEVYACETRPHWQGARLTAWELSSRNIPVTVICDHTAALIMRDKRVSAVLVGADRIAANGDVANKIGTYALARLAKDHGIPFYVLAPSSTFDLSLPSGDRIPIEHAGKEAVLRFADRWIGPRDVQVYAPIFDVAPAGYVSAIVCEKGIIYPPFQQTIRSVIG